MAFKDLAYLSRSQGLELNGAAATATVAALIAVLFAGSTVLTPLYIVYQQQFGFSQITLTLIYAVYVIGNLAALLLFGGISDVMGRRRIAIAALAAGVISALIFLFAQSTLWLYVGRILSGFAIGVGAGTGTAWLTELTAEGGRSRAAVIATSANFIGLGVGAFLAGIMAEYASWPLHLSFVVYLLVLLVVSALVWFTRETIVHPAGSIASISLRPRLSVPRDMRAQFVAPAVTGFGAMALVGFYAALMPSILAHQLHETNHAVAGLLFFELAVVVAGIIVATQRLSSRTAMQSALWLLIPGLVLIVSAQIAGSMLLMISATALCGASAGLGYRGSLQVVNQIAPEDRRAEVVSAYFLCCFSGNALPVIGIGVISTFAGLTVASTLFATMIIAFAVVALVFNAKYQSRGA